MLKFFRQYNKYILTVGVGLLMIAFLIQPTLSMFAPGPGNRAIGTIDGKEISLQDQRQASTTLQVLHEISPVLVQLAGGDPRQRINALGWLLIMHDAQAMGLSASELQADQLLATLGIEQDRLAQLARQMGVSTKLIRQALRDWIIVQTYKELAYGLSHKTIHEKLGHLLAAGQYFQFGYYQGMAMELESAYKGAPRLSAPAIKHFLHDHQSRVQIAAAAIPIDPYLVKAADPDAQTFGPAASPGTVLMQYSPRLVNYDRASILSGTPNPCNTHQTAPFALFADTLRSGPIEPT